MEALEVSGAAQSYGGYKTRRDTLKKNALCTKLQVKCRTPSPCVATGINLRIGQSTILVFNHDLERFNELVWDEDEQNKIASARTMFERKMAEEVDAQMPRRNLERVLAVFAATDGKGPLEIEKMYPSESPEDIEAKRICELRAEQYERTGYSVEAAFHYLYHRGIKPVTECKVLETDIQPPELYESNKNDATMTEQLLRGMMATLQQQTTSVAPSDEVASLREQLDTVKAQLAELLDAQTAPRKK